MLFSKGAQALLRFVQHFVNLFEGTAKELLTS